VGELGGASAVAALLLVKVSTDHLLGRSDGRNGIDRAPSAVEDRSSSLWANAVAVAGLVIITSFLATVGLVYGRGPGDAWLTLLKFLVALGLVAALITAVSARFVARSVPMSASEVRPLLIQVWRASANGWTMFFAGCALALPAFALYTPALVGDSDSARLVASILYVQDNGIDYLVDTQEVFLPHILLGPILALGGVSAVQVFNVVSVVLLSGVVAFISWRLTRSPLAVLAGVLALDSLPAILDRAYRLPMYPTMLAFGFLGVYLSHRAIVAENRSRSWLHGVLAGLCLVLTFEAHQVGQLFLVATGLLVVTARPSAALPGLARVYLAVAVVSIPRLVINVSEGGLDHFLSNRVDFWITNGYLRPIQDELFDLPVRDRLGEYVQKVPEGLLDVWGSPGLLALVLGVVGLVTTSRTLRRFALVCACFMIAVALYRRLPFYTRYFSLLLVGSALAASLAFSGPLGRIPRARRTAVAVGLVGLLASAVVSYRGTIENLQGFERAGVNGPYLRLANAIPPGGGVIGTRSVYLNFASTDVRAFGGQFLTEQEYVTFLTWPSERAVMDLMHKHDLEWIFVPSRAWRWVGRYNDIWLLPNHGEPARYFREVKQSASFCRAKKVQGASLYKLDPVGPGEAVRSRGVRRCEAPATGSSSSSR
jgi:hypothetical protein